MSDSAKLTRLRPSRRFLLRGGGVTLLAAGLPFRAAQAAPARHAIAMHGDPAWGPDFKAPTYANPTARKGGQLVQGVLGTFDSLNPFIVKGLAAANIRSYVIESLLARGYDEPFTLYGLLADSVETDAARTYVTFAINPAARFADGKSVTPEDVIFSWQLLRDKGRPNYRTYYVKAIKAEKIGARSVRFDLSGAADRELPLILGLMPVLAKHAIKPDAFEDTTFEPLLGSGPYTVSAVKPGESVTFTRDPNYWGRDLPINRGLWNFDRIKFDYYRDGNTHFEAFKKGNYDVRMETDPARWQTAYDFPALRDGRVTKEEFTYGLPKGMQGLVFNTRRPVFADIRVREAILHLFDFEWINRTYFFNLYKRTASYFDGCDLSAHGVPANARERELLKPYPGLVRADIMEGQWTPPVSDGSGGERDGLRRALALFSQAGYELKGTELTHRASGRPFMFEILTTTRDQERLALAFVRNLKRSRHQCPGAQRRRHAVRAPPHRLRFRHDGLSLGAIAVARQRAIFLLGLGRGRPAGQPQLHGREIAGGRRHDRAKCSALLRVKASSPPPARLTGCCCPASLWCPCTSRPSNGWRVGSESSIHQAPRCSAICRRLGGTGMSHDFGQRSICSQQRNG